MKNRIIIFCLVGSTLLACGNGSSKDKTLPATEPKREVVKAAQDTDKPTKTQKLGMQALIEAYLKKSEMKITFVKKDFANGYAEFRFTESEAQPIKNCQFAYYTTQNDREILAVTVPRCMQGACWTELTFYEMINGELTENQNVIEGVKDGMTSFYNLVRLSCEDHINDEEKRMKARGYMAIYHVWIDLPQQGTTIKITKETITNQQKQNVAELQFNEKTGMFTFAKR